MNSEHGEKENFSILLKKNQDCLIIENEAEYGGGCYFRDESNPILQNTSVENNLGNNSGGGMSIKDDADLIVLSSSISNNETDGIGGGVYITNASPSFEFVLIAKNSWSQWITDYDQLSERIFFLYYLYHYVQTTY